MAKDFNKAYKTGVVESVDDPTFAGRIKVRIKGLNDNIPVDQLPWCTFGGSSVFSGKGGGSISVPRVGTNVRVQFKNDDVNSMEWYGTNRIDDELREKIKNDYEGTHCLLWDTDSDLYIMYQNNTGLKFFYKDSNITIAPDNTITLCSGPENSGVQIQLTNTTGQIDIQAKSKINLTSDNTINIEAQNIVLNGEENIQLKGEEKGECAVNGKSLMMALELLATAIDGKSPSSDVISQLVSGMRGSILNERIQYI